MTAANIAVVGGGIAGLATALDLLDEAKRRETPILVSVFEKETEPGGNLRTLKEGDWQLEWGPNGFLDNEPATLRLVERLGLSDELQRSSDAARRRFLLIGGRLREIPTSPGAFLKSDMLSAGAKLRMAGEFFVRPRRNLGRAADDIATDETIAQFGRRRLGPAFADTMLDPMVKGVFGGESEKLSLAAAFPRMVELEQQYGGLFKAMIKLAKQKKKKGKAKTDAGPTGTLHSFRGGMAALIDATARELMDDERADLFTGTDVRRIHTSPAGWLVTDAETQHGPFDAVIEAAPAHAATRHLTHVSVNLSGPLVGIPFAPMAVIALGFDRSQVSHDMDGFGLLVPTKEKRDLLGALWTSSIFGGRAPGDKILVRCMAGGSGNPRVMRLDDNEMIAVALAELRPLLGIKGEPEMARVIRHDRAIAQYRTGHLARLKALDRTLARYPGLFLTGSSYRGISVNACVKEAEALAVRVLDYLSDAKDQPRQAVTPEAS